MTHQYERILRQYYHAVDKKHFNIVYSLFANDIFYSRGPSVRIHGIEELKQFYEGKNGRLIQTGKHSKLQFNIKADQVKVTGHFSGELKNGDHVEVDFIDTHTFSSQGKIINRVTEFPNDQQNI